MFKEITEELSKVLSPLLKLPTFADKKPLEIITTLSLVHNLSTETSKYERIIKSEDGARIYVVYNRLKDDYDNIYLTDVLVIDGKICLVTVMDKEVLFNLDLYELQSDLMLVTCMDAVLFIKAKYLNMFYRKDPNSMKVIFNQAPVLLYTHIMLITFDLNDVLVKTIYTTLNKNYGIEMEDVNSYIDLVKSTSIDRLLDNSEIASLKNDDKIKQEEAATNEETVQ